MKRGFYALTNPSNTSKKDEYFSSPEEIACLLFDRSDLEKAVTISRFNNLTQKEIIEMHSIEMTC